MLSLFYFSHFIHIHTDHLLRRQTRACKQNLHELINSPLLVAGHRTLLETWVTLREGYGGVIGGGVPVLLMAALATLAHT